MPNLNQFLFSYPHFTFKVSSFSDQDSILTLFNEDISPVSVKFEYAMAAKIGKLVKNSNLCEVRYSCPLNTVEMQKLFS